MSLPGGLASSYIDVTVRCPHSVRNSQGARAASATPSVAASDGELEKLTRYGSEVSAISYETYGRLGVKSQESLRSMAFWVASQATHVRRRSSIGLFAAWRLELERVLVQEIADVTLLSLGHSSGFMGIRLQRQRAG
eukprot:7725560-Karenia_brevis.AAC.1